MMADHSHAGSVFIVGPYSSEAHDSSETTLNFCEFFGDSLVRGGCVFANGAEELLIPCNEGDDCLAVVLGDILSLIAGCLLDFSA